MTSVVELSVVIWVILCVKFISSSVICNGMPILVFSYNDPHLYFDAAAITFFIIIDDIKTAPFRWSVLLSLFSM